jgi:16S rRNA (uracil1498-N3)-methyltransferase
MEAAAAPRAAAQVFVGDLDHPSLDATDRHHLTRVLRLRPGELVVAANGRGRTRLCRLMDTDHGTLEADGDIIDCPAPHPPLTVAFAPVKGDRPEWVVHKLTELGIDRIAPLLTDRAVVRWSDERVAHQHQRLGRVAREAAAQSRRAWLPEVWEPVSLPGLVELSRSEGATLALADRSGMPLTPEHTVIAVGPEGGWSDAELAMGLPTVRLGIPVLRSETAALAAGTLAVALRAALVRAAP